MLSSMITIIPAAGFCVYSIVKGIKNKFQSVHDKVLLCLIAGLLIFWVIYLFVRLPQTRTTAQMMAENCKNHEEAMWNMVNYTLDALNENSDVSIHLLNDGSFDIDIPNQNDLTDSAEKMQSAGLDSIEVNEIIKMLNECECKEIIIARESEKPITVLYRLRFLGAYYYIMKQDGFTDKQQYMIEHNYFCVPYSDRIAFEYQGIWRLDAITDRRSYMRNHSARGNNSILTIHHRYMSLIIS